MAFDDFRRHHPPLADAIVSTANQTCMADPSGALESSADFTRGGGAPTPDHDATEQARSERLATEQRRLLEWASANGRLTRRSTFPEMARGGEHSVFFSRARRRYYKVTLPNRHKGYGIALGSYSRGATPSEYLDRCQLQNELFGDDIRLEKIVENGGFPKILISQPALEGELPSQSEIDELMSGGGYQRITQGAYYERNRGVVVVDLFPRNALKTRNGQLCPFDPVIQRVHPDFAEFLMAHPDTINRAW